MGQQDSMSALPAARLTTNQGSSSGKTEPILEPAAQQPTRTRSSRAMHRLNADPEQEAAQAGAIRRERSTRRRLSPEQHKRARHVSGDRRALDIADRHHGAACCPPLVLIMLLSGRRDRAAERTNTCWTKRQHGRGDFGSGCADLSPATVSSVLG
jgi:hypothetical protein